MRFVVVGSSCSGKTTLAGRLASILETPHIELDSLHWGPNWTPVPEPQFRESVSLATSQPAWVCDGNYRRVRDLIWPRADVVIWLDYPFPIVLYRAFARTLTRLVTGKELFNGNRESVRLMFDRDWIPWWVMRTFWMRRRELAIQIAEPSLKHLRVLRFRKRRDADAFLRDPRRALGEQPVA